MSNPISVYEFFNESKGYFRFPKLTLTTPVKQQENREVKDYDNRGGFLYTPHVAHNKAELYVTVRDTKTRDTDNQNAYSYTNVVIARHDGNGHGFIFHNPVVEAIVSKDIYERLYALKAVQGDYFPGEFIRVDLTRLHIFPSFTGNYRNLRDSIDTEKLRVKELELIREGARKFGQRIGTIIKGTRAPKPEVSVEDADGQVQTLIPSVVKENYYYVNRVEDFYPEVEELKSKYRYERGKGRVISEADYASYNCENLADVQVVAKQGNDYICNLKVGIYKTGCFDEVKQLIKASREILKVLCESSRIYELFLLERGFRTPAGFDVAWAVNTKLEYLLPWQAAQLRRQGVIVTPQEQQAEQPA